MGGRDARHGADGRAAGWLVPVALVLALVVGGVVWRTDLLEDLWDDLTSEPAPDPETEPAAVPPPAGLDLPEPAEGTAVADPVPLGATGAVDAAAVRRVLGPRLRDRQDLGRRAVGAVAALDGGPVVRVGAAGAVVPASLTKLLTGAAALSVLGPQTAFTTRTVLAPGDRLTLVGGGDPLLAGRPVPADDTGREAYPPRADVRTLARRTAGALLARDVTRVRLTWDDTLFSGPPASRGWRADYLPDDVVAPIGALWIDEGRSADGGRVDDPPRVAARSFADALRRAGVEVTGAPRRGRAPADASEVASVTGAPVAAVVEHVVEVSDNEGAEVLAHHVGLATGDGGSFVGGAAATLSTLGSLDVPLPGARLFDGSGLSRRNRLTPETVVGVLRLAADPDHPELRPLLSGLPVAGYTGSLSTRFDSGDAAGPGAVRAKTGTLTGVHGLAGLVTTRDGATLAFVLDADRVPGPKNLDARLAIDEAAAALAACRCGGGAP